jgi:hypothetical protein
MRYVIQPKNEGSSQSAVARCQCGTKQVHGLKVPPWARHRRQTNHWLIAKTWLVQSNRLLVKLRISLGRNTMVRSSILLGNDGVRRTQSFYLRLSHLA